MDKAATEKRILELMQDVAALKEQAKTLRQEMATLPESTADIAVIKHRLDAVESEIALLRLLPAELALVKQQVNELTGARSEWRNRLWTAFFSLLPAVSAAAFVYFLGIEK